MFKEYEPPPIRENTKRHEFVRSHLERMHNALVGKTVNRVRYASREECDVFLNNCAAKDEWRTHFLVVEFTDGTKLFASADDDLNAPGMLCVAPQGEKHPSVRGESISIHEDELDLYEGCE